MAASIAVHLQIFKRPQLLRFSTNLDITSIKIHGLSRSFIENIVINRVAVPFNYILYYFNMLKLYQHASHQHICLNQLRLTCKHICSFGAESAGINVPLASDLQLCPYANNQPQHFQIYRPFSIPWHFSLHILDRLFS